MKLRLNPADWPMPDWQRFARVLWQTAKRFEGMERRKEAAALTYTTLFALVPGQVKFSKGKDDRAFVSVVN